MYVLDKYYGSCTAWIHLSLPLPYPLTLQQEYDPGQPLHWGNEEVLQTLACALRPRLVSPQEGMEAGVLLVTAVQALLADLKVVDEGRIHVYQLVSLCEWRMCERYKVVVC